MRGTFLGDHPTRNVDARDMPVISLNLPDDRGSDFCSYLNIVAHKTLTALSGMCEAVFTRLASRKTQLATDGMNITWYTTT